MTRSQAKQQITTVFKQNVPFLILSIISGIFRSFLMLLPTYFTSLTINEIETSQLNKTIFYIGMILACQIVVLLLYMLDTHVNRYIFLLGSKLRKDIFASLFGKTSLTVMKEQLVDHVVHTSADISMHYYQSISHTTWFIATFFGASYLMFKIDQSITLLVLLLTCIQISVTLIFRRAMKEMVKEDIRLKGENLYDVLAFYDHSDYLTIDQSEKLLQQSLFQISLANLGKNARKRSWMISIYNLISNLLNVLKQTVVLYFSYSLFSQGELSIGAIFALNSYAIWIVPVVIGIQDWIKDVHINESNLELFDMLTEKTKDSVTGYKVKQPTQSEDVELVFANMLMKNALNETIEHFSLVKGEVAIVKGMSGSGKTALAKALMGLNNFYDHKIFINDRPIDEYTQEWLVSNLTYCSQESFLFEATLLSNLRLNHCEVSEDILEDFLLFFNLDHINLKEKLTANEISHLSDGEKKRLSLIRALIRDTNVYVFDEPTASLDEENRRKFYQLIQTQLLDKIVIIITHDNDFRSILDNYKELYFL